MKQITLEWINKAEGDFTMAIRESRARKRPNYDGLCFHAQQCAEKYLKARLVEADRNFPKTHDLVLLLDLVLDVEPLWMVHKKALAYLSDYAIAFRYPGENATKADTKSALKYCKNFREEVRKSLGLPTD